MDKETLSKKTVAELREQAKEIPDAKGLSSMKKDDLIELILAQSNVAATGGKPKPATTKTTPKASGSVSVQTTDKAQIKRRIKELKAEKQEARAQEDVKRAKECNRGIHDLKRLLRKAARRA
jgi:hypothetical protein